MMQETLVIFRYNVQRMHCAFLFCIVSFHIRNSPSWVPFDWKRISLLFSSISSFFFLPCGNHSFFLYSFAFLELLQPIPIVHEAPAPCKKILFPAQYFFLPSRNTPLCSLHISPLSPFPSCPLLFRPKTHKKEGIAASVMSIYHGHDFHIQSPPQPRSLNAFHFG